MVNTRISEPGTLEHELHECLSRLVDAGKIRPEEEDDVLNMFDQLDDASEFSPEFQERLRKLFELDADVLDAQDARSTTRVAVLGDAINAEEEELDSNPDEEWDVVEKAAKKQKLLLEYVKDALVPFDKRLSELQTQEDQAQHSALLQETMNAGTDGADAPVLDPKKSIDAYGTNMN